ncbi:MAG TPA: response regulator [Desulfuromonadales bacterium]|nr:response regulator [Desulfuromonadales bacterium]
MNKRKRIGELLVEAGAITEATVQAALERQKGTSKRLGIVLEEMGAISEKDIAAALSRQFGYKLVRDFAKFAFPAELLALVDAEQALKSMIFPLKQEDKTLYLAMMNPLDMDTIDNVAFRTGLRIVPCVTTAADIQEAVNRHYLQAGQQTEKSEWWTVLVVDDQEMVRLAIVAALRKEGYSLLQASNGAEGLKIALQQKPHLIITDTVMPRMDGYEMFRALQASAATRNIPVIALSSKAAAEEEAKILDMGYFDFVAKPINPFRLTARTKRALRLVYGEGKPPAR